MAAPRTPSDVPVDFWLSGQLRLRRADAIEILGTTLLHEVLALLLLNANTAVPISQIISSVWPRKGNTDDGIRSYITRARHLVADLDCRIESLPRSYILKVDPMRVDVHRFGLLVDEAHRGDEAVRRRSIGEAMELCPNDTLLVGFGHDWVRAARQQFRPKWRVAALLRNRVWLDDGEYERLLAALDWKFITKSADQRMAEDFLRALYHSGHTAEAITHFDAFSRALSAANIGVQPSLRRLGAQLASEDPALDNVRGRTAAGAPNLLPPLTARLEGRHADLRAMEAYAASRDTIRVIGIYGSPGIGKTSLAVTFAHRARSRYSGGVLFAQLAHARSSTGVDIDGTLESFLRALGVRPEGIPADRAARVARYQELLRSRVMLLVLDNVESTEDVVPLLPTGPGSLVLVTSRNRLTALTARHAAMAVVLGPIDESASIAVLGRLAGSRPDWSASAARELARICSGHPLALCLAAARLATRPEEPIESLAEVFSRPGERIVALDEYAEKGEAVVDVVGWSYRALTPSQARVFRLLGLSPSPSLDLPTVAALVDLTPDVAETILADLVRAHLVTEPVDRRFGMLDLIAEYAAALTAQVDDDETRWAALDRLYRHYGDRARGAAHLLWPQEVADGPAEHGFDDAVAARAWLDEHRAEIMAAAADPAVSDRPEFVIDIANSLFRYLDHGGFLDQAIALLRAAADAARRSGDDGRAAMALGRLGAVMFRRGQFEDAEAVLQEARATSVRVGDVHGEATALGNLGRVASRRGFYAEAVEYQLSALRIFRRTGAQLAQARTLTNLGVIHRQRGEFAKALACLEEARALCAQLDARDAGARASATTAGILRAQGRLDEAEALYLEAIEGFRALGDRVGEASALSFLGLVRTDQGRHAEAIELHESSLAIFDEMGDHAGHLDTLLHLGSANLAAGRVAEAIRLHRGALDRAGSLGDVGQAAQAHARLAEDYAIAARRSDIAAHASSLARTHLDEALGLFKDLGIEPPAALLAVTDGLPPT